MASAKASEIWEAALGDLQLQVTRPYFETYLKNTVGLDWEGGRFVVGVPTSFVVEWLCLRMKPRIEETLTGITKRPIYAQFVVCQDPQAAGHPSMQKAVYSQDTDSDEREPTSDVESQAPSLNHRYTFDSFVVGGFNRMAHAGASTVVESPGQYYNPLFIYSSAGLGKTHLLQAIGHAGVSHRKKVLYVSAEQFTNDFISSIREKDTDRFREKYRNVDLLLVDDIQFISGKEQTQEGFYHTFNYLHNANKQIVIACDCHPREIPIIEDRLVSRFEGGLLADIGPPDLDARVALLEAKATRKGIQVDREVLDVIARQVRGSVRQLEGALNRIIAYAKASRSPITTQLATEALSATPGEAAPNLSPNTVIDCAAAHFNIDPEDLRGKKRIKRLVEARHIAMYLLREELKLSPMRIGALVGHRTPTSVAMSYRKVAATLPRDAKLRTDLSVIRDCIYSGQPLQRR
ncbi:MAG: chromosomal replication initiator protein DnaA [Dehalococcoidia bacterium]